MDEQLRIGDAEREAAAAELGEHYAQGRLTAEEHAERLDRVWSSRTRGDLAPIFRDLPGRYGPVAPRAGVRRPPRWVPAPILAVFAVLLVLTAITHVPLVLLGVVVFAVVAMRRRRWSRGWSGEWSRWAR